MGMSWLREDHALRPGVRCVSISRVGRILLAAGVLLCLALAAAPEALADSTWTGGAGLGASGWSSGANWSGGVAPTPGSAGTLTFPALASCNPGTNTCYQSRNDLTGAVLDGIRIDDGVGYNVTGNAVTLGAGGIDSSTSGYTQTLWAPAISLSANQTWSLNGGAFLLQDAVTGRRTRSASISATRGAYGCPGTTRPVR